MYGWGAASFSRPESQQPHNIPLAYFKGPAGVLLLLDSIDTQTGTGMLYMFTSPFNIFLFSSLAERDVDYVQDSGVQLLPLNPAGTTSVIFRPDFFALELDETIVLDLDLVAIFPSNRMPEFDTILPNVFFQRDTVLYIQDTTGDFHSSNYIRV